MHETILQSIGRTPLVRLRRVTEGLKTSVYVKLEAQNPGGSVKDRVGLAMISEAERTGQIRREGHVLSEVHHEVSAHDSRVRHGIGSAADSEQRETSALDGAQSEHDLRTTVGVARYRTG